MRTIVKAYRTIGLVAAKDLKPGTLVTLYAAPTTSGFRETYVASVSRVDEAPEGMVYVVAEAIERVGYRGGLVPTDGTVVARMGATECATVEQEI